MGGFDAGFKPGRCRSLHRDGRDGGRPRAGSAAAATIIHMEVGQPGTPAPAAARAALAPRDGGGRARLYRGAGLPALRAGSRGSTASGTASTSTPPRDRDRRVLGGRSSWPSRRCSTRATGSRSGAGLPELPPHPEGADLCSRWASRPGREPVPAGARRPARRAAGLIVASPANPTGTMLGKALAALSPAATARRRLRLGRDLPRHALRRRPVRRWR
jgi:hypothetical protein